MSEVKVSRREVEELLKEKYNGVKVFAHMSGYIITVEDDEDEKDS